MNKGYVLKANAYGGVVYYMNIICVTSQKECAEVFPTKKDAEARKQHFGLMFHYEEPVIEIEEV